MKRFSFASFSSVLIVFAGLLLQSAIAQDSLVLKPATYKATITFTDKRFVQDYLVDFTDTSLLTRSSPFRFRYYSNNSNAVSVPYTQIDNVVIKRKGNGGRGALIGLFSGAALGGIIGAITYKDCDGCLFDFGIGFDIGVGAFLGSMGGTLTGLIIGSLMKKRFIINGQRDKFEQMKLSVIDMAYRKPK